MIQNLTSLSEDVLWTTLPAGDIKVEGCCRGCLSHPMPSKSINIRSASCQQTLIIPWTGRWNMLVRFWMKMVCGRWNWAMDCVNRFLEAKEDEAGWWRMMTGDWLFSSFLEAKEEDQDRLQKMKLGDGWCWYVYGGKEGGGRGGVGMEGSGRRSNTGSAEGVATIERHCRNEKGSRNIEGGGKVHQWKGFWQRWRGKR